MNWQESIPTAEALIFPGEKISVLSLLRLRLQGVQLSPTVGEALGDCNS